MIEELEGVNSSGTKVNEVSELSNKELDYLKECIAPPRPDSLALRIDELQNSTPPKALDSNPQIAEIIEPIKDFSADRKQLTIKLSPKKDIIITMNNKKEKKKIHFR